MKVLSMHSLSRLQARTGSVAVLAAAAASSCALVFDDAVESDDVEDKRHRFNNALPNMAHTPVLLYRYQPALCESNPPPRADQHASTTLINVPSRGRRLLNHLGIVNLPVPRILTPTDPIFSYPEMKAGIRQRAGDEAKLRSLQTEAIEARNSGDTQRINAVFEKISSIAYGVGVKPQDREDFLVKYGCTGWTGDIIKHIIDLGKDRGVVEVGAGNGQWSKAIQNKYEELCASGDVVPANRTKNFEFILPFDDMSELPLSPQVYHRLTAPAREYFANVRKSSHVDALRNKWETRGRVLLLVYPPPGPMAIESLQAYLDVYPEGNDTLVYVGEGRGGANANDAFFDYICFDGSWAVEKIMDVEASPGGKGYEKCFVLRRIKN